MTGKDYPQVEQADDPRRCQGSSSRGQCWNVAVQGYDKCPKCGGRQDIATRRNRRTYLLDVIQNSEEYEACQDIDHIRPLRVELAQLRVLLQEKLSVFAQAEDWEGADSITNIENAIAKLYRVEKEVSKWLAGCWSFEQLVEMTNAMVDVAQRYVSDDLGDLRDQALSIVHAIREQPEDESPVPEAVLAAMGKYREDFERFHEADRQRSLLEEISLARYAILRMFRMSQTALDLAKNSGAIVKTIETVAALVKEGIRLEIENNGWVHQDELRPIQDKLSALVIPRIRAIENYEQVSDEIVAEFEVLDQQYRLTHVE